MGLRQRFQAVRAELQEIHDECATLPDLKSPERADITPKMLEYLTIRTGTIANQLARLCRLLVRVIDALP